MRVFKASAVALGIWLIGIVLGAASAAPIQTAPPMFDIKVPEESAAAATFRRGVQALVDNDLETAEASFRKAARLDPKIPEPLLGLADVALRRGRTQDALDYLRKAESVAPGNSAVHVSLGRYYRAQRDFAQAEVSFRKALQPTVVMVPAHMELGDLYLQQGRLEEAVAQFRAATRGRPDSAQAQYGLGIALSALGNFGEAVKAFEAAARLAPRDFAPHQALARLYTEQRRYDDALVRIEAAIALMPQLPQLYLDKGDILATRGNVEGAEAAYRKALRIDAANATAMNNIAWLLADRKASLDEALDLARRATAAQPDNPIFADTLGWVYRARGERPEAVKAFETAIKLAPDFADSHYHLGLLHEELGNKALARASYAQALKLGLAEPRASDARKRVAALGVG